MRIVVALALTAAVLTGCGDTDPPRAAPSQGGAATTAVSGAPERFAGPLKGPRFRLHLASGPVDVKAWTACYDNGCYDGAPPANLVDVGHTDAVEFSFAQEGWTFEVTFRETGTTCPREIKVPAVPVSPTRFRVLPAGNAGAWDVDVFGRGPDGDAVTTFRWVTRSAGTFPAEATSSLSVLADHDGRLDSYGVELGVSDLAPVRPKASASVTVIAASGARARIDLGRPRGRCNAAGSLAWQRDSDATAAAVALPGHDFRYVVRLELDGKTYTGRGSWPEDTNEEIAPAVPLTWTPALPVYRG